MLKNPLKSALSVALASGLLSLAITGLANNNRFEFTLKNASKDTIQITGYQNAVDPGPINPTAPIVLPPVTPEEVTIPAGGEQTFVFNCPSKGHVSGNLTFTDKKTQQTGAIQLFDPWEAYAGSPNFQTFGDNTTLQIKSETRRSNTSPDDLYLVAAQAKLV